MIKIREEKKKIWDKNWKEKNKEYVIEYNKEYRKNNIEKIASYTMFSDIDKVNRQKIKRMEYFDKFCKLIKKKGGNVLSETNEYFTAHSKLLVSCNREHEFTTTLSNVNKNRWCPDCNCYQNELYTRVIFEHIFKQDFIKIRPSWLLNDEGNRLEIDIYNEQLNLAVEYNGIQHYKYVEYFHKNIENFEKLVKNDKLKEKIIKEKGINFIVIPYTVINIYEYILNKLNLLKIEHIVPEYLPNIDILSLNEGLFKVLKIINIKNGQLIEGNYITGESLVKIKCPKGHEWTTKMCKIISGSWCHVCCLSVSSETREKISKTMKEKIASGSLIVKTPIRHKSIRPIDLIEKKCTKCNKIKTIDNFNKKTTSADGFQPYCGLCMNEAKKESRLSRTEETFKCEFCSKIYALKDSLTRHIKEKHKI